MFQLAGVVEQGDCHTLRISDVLDDVDAAVGEGHANVLQRLAHDWHHPIDLGTVRQFPHGVTDDTQGTLLTLVLQGSCSLHRVHQTCHQRGERQAHDEDKARGGAAESSVSCQALPENDGTVSEPTPASTTDHMPPGSMRRSTLLQCRTSPAPRAMKPTEVCTAMRVRWPQP